MKSVDVINLGMIFDFSIAPMSVLMDAFVFHVVTNVPYMFN